MENASKALLMAGGVLLTMLVVSLLMYAWNMYSDYQNEQDRLQMIEDTAKFNQQFTNYERDDVYGYDVLSLVNKAIDYNQRLSEAGINTGKKAGNSAAYKSINIIVNIPLDADLDNQLRRTVTLPGGGSPIKSVELFEAGKNYGLDESNKTERHEKLIPIINTIETIEDAKIPGTNQSLFGGATGLQNLIKNIDTIYQGNVIGINGNPTSADIKNWYEEAYIVSRYKTLTGVLTTLSNIRSENKIKQVLQYYEYSQFKKASFNCTNVQYDNDTGRVISMSFEYKGIQ